MKISGTKRSPQDWELHSSLKALKILASLRGNPRKKKQNNAAWMDLWSGLRSFGLGYGHFYNSTILSENSIASLVTLRTKMQRYAWPKTLPPLTEQQKAISDDWMRYWHSILPNKYGVIEKFN